MREIKFRGKWNGKWYYGNLVVTIGGTCFISLVSSVIQRVDTDTVGQFTGLYDCTRSDIYPNGRPIYEGDIVKVDGWRKPTLVEWFDANAQFVIDGSLNLGLRNSFMQVIGNVHDTSELLEADHERD